MSKYNDILTIRRGLDEICRVPEKIISVYSLEKHVWADSHSDEARKNRKPELKTIDELQIDPVRPFLTDIFRNMAAPYNPKHRDNPIGQGYWIQAEFGSGKSHLLSFVAALSLGQKKAWDIVKLKEECSGRGKRESLYRFWENGLESKSHNNSKGIFVVVKTLVGAGSGAIGVHEKGKRFSEYILDAVKEQLFIELGKNISLYPVEILADRFLSSDMDRYRKDLAKFLRDPCFFEEDEFEEIEDFIGTIQQDKSPEYKRSCGNKLWRFYTEYLQVQPQVAAETEEVLKHLVEMILAEGYCGVLLVLDEVSLFMKDRDENQRIDDEKTLVVLANRLAKVYNLPIWTVCAAQQALESKMGVKNIIADDRLKLVKLLESDKDYYDIVLSRVREIKNLAAIGNYYQYYKRGFTWPNSIGEEEFRHFFPFHKPAIEVLRAVTFELTTARSAIHFMHQTLKHQIKNKGYELIRLWELFDETVRYEEDPSGVHAGLVAIKTKKENEYRAYASCKRQIDGFTKGYLKVHRDKAIKILQTLFLYYIAKTRQQGLTVEEIANSVLIERDSGATPEENIQHFETIAENLKKELRQIAQNIDEEKRARYRFDPVFAGIDPREEFHKARNEAESNELSQKEAWEHLLALDGWPVRLRQMTIDFSCGVRSLFREVPDKGSIHLEINWKGRQILGTVAMCDLTRMASKNELLPLLETDQTDHDFAVYIGIKPTEEVDVQKLLEHRKDPRIIVWSPDTLKQEERERLIDFAAYRKLLSNWQGRESEDAVTVIHWLYESLQADLARIEQVVRNSYARGRIDALNNTNMNFHIAGELVSILTPPVDRVLTSTYESGDIGFDPPFLFRKEEAVKVINGIVKTGQIPNGAKPNQNINAAQNFGYSLGIMKRGAEKKLDVSGNRHVKEMWHFIDDKLTDGAQAMKIETLYKNFMGIGGPKDYGLTRRMVQIFLLSLVREGRIRISVSPKSGLSNEYIDYTNIAEIDFSAKVLDALAEVQKVAKPENWEILRPYAEKLLGIDIQPTDDDTVIATYRSSLCHHFAQEGETSAKLFDRCQSFFEAIKKANPYEKEINQIANLYSQIIDPGDDINLILYALKIALGYQAFDLKTASQIEADDLANRLCNYRNLRTFLDYEHVLRIAHDYTQVKFPDSKDYDSLRSAINAVSEKFDNLQKYIDSEVKLKTDFLGYSPPNPGETQTITYMFSTYASAYHTLHETVVDKIESYQKTVQAILKGKDLDALKKLEEVTALQPKIAGKIKDQLKESLNSIFICNNPSRVSVKEDLRQKPFHECGLSFVNANEFIQHAAIAATQARQNLDQTIELKMAVFFNPAVRERLRQGKDEAIIAGLLDCKDAQAVWRYLVEKVATDNSLVDLINRYLKRIVIKRIRISEFKTQNLTIQREQIDQVADEFKKFLDDQFENFKEDDNKVDLLPMLQLE